MSFLHYIPFLIFFILFGLRFFGQGSMGHVSQTSMARYFVKDRGKAISFASFGQPIAEIILPLLVVIFISFVGWRFTWFYSGISIILIFIPIYLYLLKDHGERHKNFIKDSIFKKDVINFNRIEILKDSKLYIYLPSYLMPPFIITGLLFYQVHIAFEKDWSLQLLGSSFVFYGIFGVIGVLLGGPLVDKYNTRSIVPIYLIPMFFGILFLSISSNSIVLFFYMASISFSAGFGFPLMGSLWAELYGVKNLGSIRALLHAIGVFSTAISPYLFGYFIDKNFGTNFIFIFCLILIFISSILTYIFRGK